jgi:hypothetical protein
MNQARDLAHKPAQKLANAARFKAAGQARFKTGTILPVYGRLLSNQIVTIQLTSDLPDSGVKSAHIHQWSNNQG